MFDEYQKQTNTEIMESFQNSAIKRQLKRELDEMYADNKYMSK